MSNSAPIHVLLIQLATILETIALHLRAGHMDQAQSELQVAQEKLRQIQAGAR